MTKQTSYELLSKLYLTHNGESFITPERMKLLSSIDAVGSISGGAKAIGKSYKWAWDSIAQMNEASQTLLVSRSSGGKGGGGACVTDFAKDLIVYYADLDRIHQSKLVRYQEGFEAAFTQAKVHNNIASTLHGVLKKIVCDGNHCELVITYGQTELKAKCHCDFKLQAGDEVAFMVEANQIIIAKEAVAISAQNMLVGEIVEVTQEEKDVYLSLRLESNERLQVLITEASLEQFELEVGVRCYAYFKTYNITILGEEH